MVLGAAIAALAPAVATLDEIKALGGSVLGPILVLILALGLIPPSAMNIYGGALATLTIANNVRRFTSTAALRVLACLFVAVVSLGVATVGSGNFMTSFENYLSALLYFLIPWTAINLTDFYLIRGGVYRTEDFFEPNGAFGRFNWRGLLVYFVTFAIEIPFMNTTVFQGPLSKALGGADLNLRIGDLALLVDDEVAANDTHIRLAVVRPLAPRAVGLGDRVILIHQQRERQIELGLELLVRRDAIGADGQIGARKTVAMDVTRDGGLSAQRVVYLLPVDFLCMGGSDEWFREDLPVNFLGVRAGGKRSREK